MHGVWHSSLGTWMSQGGSVKGSELYTWDTEQPGMRGDGGRSRLSPAWQFPNERRQRDLQEGQALGGALLCADTALARRPTA